jgi:peptide/nickel transport system substrate-binding protein
VEKKLPLPWDMLVHAWFDLTADAPPAVMHREFFHTVGAFRAGPPVPEFDQLFAEYVQQVDQRRLEEIGARLDRLAYDGALALFLASPQALYAVNEHVSFVAHRTTFELAETEVSEQHWSRR